MRIIFFIIFLASSLIFGLAKPTTHDLDVQDPEYLQSIINFENDNFNEFDGDSEYDIVSGRVKSVEDLKALGFDLSTIPQNVLKNAFLSTPEIIDNNGYHSEIHRVRTRDGYNLELHRISGKRNALSNQNKQPVFLMHGLMASSACWIMTGTETGLAYLLSDLGYDVWMGNARGNQYSRSHISLNPDGKRNQRKKFWDFSWHEIGVIDLPTMIDYVLAETKYEKIHYIGHSQGTTSFFVMASELPEYNDKILSMNALAPVAFMSHLRDPVVRTATTFLNTLDHAKDLIGMYEFPPNNLFQRVTVDACLKEAHIKSLCMNQYFLIGGSNMKYMNMSKLPTMFAQMPNGASSNQLIHYGQEIRSNHFRQYDWGIVNNMKKYKSIHPPDYKIENIRAPVALHYASKDLLAEPVDVEHLHKNLPNSLGMIHITDPDFTHLDFITSDNVKELLYDRVFEIMKSFE